MKYRRVTRSDMPHAVTVRLLQRNDGCEAVILPVQTSGDDAREGEADLVWSAQGRTFPVPEALDRAAALLRVKSGLLEVVVQLSEGTEWNPSWGKLI